MMNLARVQVTLYRALAWGLSRLGESHVWLMFRKDLRQALTPVHAEVPITVDLADASQMDELAAMYHAGNPDQAPSTAKLYRKRLRTGGLCFVARIEGKTVGYNWVRVGHATGAAEVPMVLQDDEIYTDDAYTSEAWRGQGIHPAVNHAMLKYARERGYRTAYTLARADNARALVALPRVGWTLSATLLVFEPAWAKDELVWLVSGSPYPMPVAGLASLRVPTLAELHKQQQFDGDAELVKARPWSYTYRLHKADAKYYLKIVHREHASGLRAAEPVARAYPEHVPAVVACNHAFESWMLTRDHGGTGLDDRSPSPQLMKMLETYASLQARAATNPDLLARLPSARIDDLVRALLGFLRSGESQDEDPDRADASFFLGDAEARRFFDALSARRDLLEMHVARAKQLPCTLNHGNLLPSNAAMTASGEVMLFNWTRAVSGPAGLSLHALLGGLLPRELLLGSDAGDAEADPARHSLLHHYVQTLVRCGYADEDTLRGALPASITAGLLLAVLHLARYPMDKAEDRQLLRERLTIKLNQVLDLCDHLCDPAAAGMGDGR
jgi:ribosomal protein S18 acetylase RimI-like enzyme